MLRHLIRLEAPSARSIQFFPRAKMATETFSSAQECQSGGSDRSRASSARKESHRWKRKRAKFLQSRLNTPRDRIPRRLLLRGLQRRSIPARQPCEKFRAEIFLSRQSLAPAASLRNSQTRARFAAAASVLRSVPDPQTLPLANFR